MDKRLILAAALCSFMLFGCGSKKDASERNFGAAISQYLEKRGDLCLGLGDWPIDISKIDHRSRQVRLDALVAIGVATVWETEVDQLDHLERPTGRKVKVRRYELTDTGKKFYSEREVQQSGMMYGGKYTGIEGDICYGKKSLDKIVKWEGPMKFGDYQIANVMYLYKIDKLADWAKKNEFLSVFSDVDQIIKGAGQKTQKHVVNLTSEGWEAKGLDQLPLRNSYRR